MNTTTTTAVQTTGKKTPPTAPTLRQQLESPAFAAQIAKALPKHLTADRFIRVACTTVMRTPKLAQCDQVSFFNALLTLSQLGIEPDGRRAHLIPFENRKRGVIEVQLIVDFKGLVELAMRSGSVANIHADIVCDNDEFDYNCGEIVKHRINFKQPRGEMFAAYAVCTFKDGTKKCEVMSKSEIDGIRGRSRAANAGPWVSDYNEMSKKTVFRRLSKWLPLSPEMRDGIEADDDQFNQPKVSAPIFSAPAQPKQIFAEPETEAETPQPDEAHETDDVPMDSPTPLAGKKTSVESQPESAREFVQRLLTEAQVPFDDLRDFVRTKNIAKDADSWTDYAEIPEPVFEVLSQAKTLSTILKIYGKKS